MNRTTSVLCMLLVVAALSPSGRALECSSRQGEVTFAAVEFGPVSADLLSNRDRLAQLVQQAAQDGARLVVLPELGLTGAITGPADAHPETVPGPTTLYFGAVARKYGVCLAVSLAESDPGAGDYHIATVLMDDSGIVRYKYNKIMVRFHHEDGAVSRGNYRDTQHTVDACGLRVGVISGDDLRIGVPRLANLGAEAVLIPAEWNKQDPTDWKSLAQELAIENRTVLVVANRRRADGSGSGFGGIYTDEGRVISSTHLGEEDIVVAPLPKLKQEWLIPSALGLPESVPVPRSVPVTPEIAELGRRIFMDKNLSQDRSVACASCHDPQKAFTNGRDRGVGVYGRKTKRNVPSLLNVAFRPLLRWDGYASSIENFVKYPISDVNEMNFHYVDKVSAYMQSRPDYVNAFRKTMNVRHIQFDDVARALAAYQRTLISGNSPFDRYYYGGDAAAMSKSAQRGFSLFTSKAGCSQCHTIGDHQALFTDFTYHATGVGFDSQSGVYSDIGLGGISTDDQTGKFQTPTLRNVALTAPYMHDGGFTSLEEVIDYYNRGGNPATHLDPAMKPLGLSAEERADLVAFLGALTGDQQYRADGKRVH